MSRMLSGEAAVTEMRRRVLERSKGSSAEEDAQAQLHLQLLDETNARLERLGVELKDFGDGMQRMSQALEDVSRSQHAMTRSSNRASRMMVFFGLLVGTATLGIVYIGSGGSRMLEHLGMGADAAAPQPSIGSPVALSRFDSSGIPAAETRVVPAVAPLSPIAQEPVAPPAPVAGESSPTANPAEAPPSSASAPEPQTETPGPSVEAAAPSAPDPAPEAGDPPAAESRPSDEPKPSQSAELPPPEVQTAPAVAPPPMTPDPVAPAASLPQEPAIPDAVAPAAPANPPGPTASTPPAETPDDGPMSEVPLGPSRYSSPLPTPRSKSQRPVAQHSSRWMSLQGTSIDRILLEAVPGVYELPDGPAGELQLTGI